MKKNLLILLFFCQLPTLHAQERTRQREVGLVFSGLDRFGFTYRVGRPNSLWRFSSVFGGGSSSSEVNSNSKTEFTSNSFGLTSGREFRKTLAENISFRFGVDIIYEYSGFARNTDDLTGLINDTMLDRKKHSFGMGIALGLNYVVGKHFTIGAEILPSFTFTTGTEIEKTSFTTTSTATELSGFNYIISSGSAALSVVYVF